jgi:hypothetical protein
MKNKKKFFATTSSPNKLLLCISIILTSHLMDCNVVLAPALILTTADTISLVYPKEMGYEKDFLHIIFKLTSTPELVYRIEDAVYDTKTFSIYFILSNGSSSGSELVRLKRENNGNKPHTNAAFHRFVDETNANNYSYELATAWSFSRVYANQTSKLLSLDLNVEKRKLYWFEFNVAEKKWLLVIYKLMTNRIVFKKFNDYNFNGDGYSFITVARDVFVQKFNVKNKTKEYFNDIVFFVSNNQTLNICFSANMTCQDYFQATITPPHLDSDSKSSLSTLTTQKTLTSELNEYDYSDQEAGLYLGGQSNEMMMESNNRRNGAESESLSEIAKTSTSANSLSSSTTLLPPLYTFGRLMGIKYSLDEHAIYLNDYGNDRIEKITFESNEFKLKNIETIFKSDLSNGGGGAQTQLLNPIMSVVYDKSLLFWIDYEDGLKTTVFKSSCMRTIYKIKEPLSLKFIQITTFLSSQVEDRKNSKVNGDLLNKLVLLNGNGGKSSILKYPPDFYNNYQYSSNDFNTHSFQQAVASQVNNLQVFRNGGDTEKLFKLNLFIYIFIIYVILSNFFV